MECVFFFMFEKVFIFSKNEKEIVHELREQRLKMLFSIITALSILEELVSIFSAKKKKTSIAVTL